MGTNGYLLLAWLIVEEMRLRRMSNDMRHDRLPCQVSQWHVSVMPRYEADISHGLYCFLLYCQFHGAYALVQSQNGLYSYLSLQRLKLV